MSRASRPSASRRRCGAAWRSGRPRKLRRAARKIGYKPSSMALAIDTFSNSSGGNAFFKAVGHPLVLPKAKALLARLAARGPVALYDPQGFAEGFAALHPLASLPLAGVFVQKIEEVGRSMLGCAAQPVTELPSSSARSLLVLAFDAARAIAHIRALVPEGMEVASLDEMKLPAAMLSNAGRYLDPLNFATNFAFFRDADGHHTRLVTANYWAGYGAARTRLWCCLFDESGAEIAAWDEPLPEGVGAVVIDSRALRARFGLPPFTGQLFLHVIGARGHDVVKYALDTIGEDGERCLSTTHDANSWPAERYAGLPAPAADETVTLWVQNSHPCPIPAGAVGLNLMGRDEVRALDTAIAPFASYPLDV